MWSEALSKCWVRASKWPSRIPQELNRLHQKMLKHLDIRFHPVLLVWFVCVCVCVCVWVCKSAHPILILGSKITADGDCSHEIKRHLLLERKAMTNPDSILKSRDITWPTKVRIVRAMVFPVVIYRYESWTIKKGEHQRIDAFAL